eukprot:TRINITY_DN3512_c0_g1_i1.p1 TRINITY_DN3512_c0_g1~~TRINITY_DN3512_c0_g1_i1.p1  ORF type:complete len:1009 (+),score=266.86 TRINITY_DN3512_c0_g1_i1:119-3145(+)
MCTPQVTPPGSGGSTVTFHSPGGADMEGFSDFSRAVRVALDPSITTRSIASQSAVALRAEAEQYLGSLKRNPRIWEFCLSILRRPKESFEATEIFWCCGVLLELIGGGVYASLPDSEKTQFEAAMMSFAAEVCPHLDLQKMQFVQNKFAQLLVIAFQHSGYPTRWGSFFDEIFALLPKGMQLIDLWLRTLDAIDNYIVDNLRDQRDSDVRARDTLIKDTMRLTCIPQITNTWYHILSQYHESHPDLTRQCMQVMCPYFAWIDITLVSSDDWINMLYHFVGRVDLRDDAIGCIVELCEKKIADTSSKLQLLQSLRVTDCMPGMVSQTMIQVRPMLAAGDESFDDGNGFLSRVTDLCQVVCLELIDVLGSMLTQGPSPAASTALNMLQTCLPMLYELLSCGHSGISLKVCEYSIRKYVELLKKHPEPALSRSHLPSILNIVVTRLEYHQVAYNFDQPSDYENTVTLLRKQLLIVFRNIAALDRDMVMRMIVERVNSCIAGSPTWSQVEATLRILYTFGEELGTSKGALFKQTDNIFCKTMTDLFDSSIASQHTHQAVSLAFLEVVERYYQYFIQYPEKRPQLLQLTLGPSGVANPHPKVKAKACATFSQLAKSAKQLMTDSVDVIMANVERLLASSGLELNDKCALFETLGVLISQNEAKLPESQKYLKVMSSPLLANLTTALQARSDAYGVSVANTVLYLAYLSKGFSGLSAPAMGRVNREVVEAWKEIAHAVMACGAAYAHVQSVREKVLLFVHRMIDLLGTGVLVYITPLVEQMTGSCDITDACKLVRVPTQLLQRMKAEAVPVVDGLFVPLIGKVFELTSVEWLGKVSIMHSEQAREHLDLLRAYYALLIQAAQPECIHLFLTEKSKPTLNMVLESLSRGCVSHPEMDVAKTSYQIITKMAMSWYTTLPGFSGFLAQQVVPMTLHTIQQPSFSPSDAKCYSVVGEIANLYVFLNSAAGADAFLLALQNTWNLPAEHVAMAQQALTSASPAKAMKTLVRQWSIVSRS